jgi:hypothetical protein
MEMRTVIATVLKMVDLVAADPMPEVMVDRFVTLAPKNGTRVIARAIANPEVGV